MEVTECMLEAAIRKATEAGLFSQRSTLDEMECNREVMFSILNAALTAAGMEVEEEEKMPPMAMYGELTPYRTRPQ